MKTKSTHRFTALVLAIVMLASVFTLPTFAEESQPKEPQVFAYVDFEDAENETSEDPAGSSIAAEGLKDAHTYVTVAQDDLHGKYAVVPFRGTTYVEDVGGRPVLKGTGNFGDAIEIKHPGISYEDYLGVNVEFDVFLSHKALEGEKDPTVDFRFRWINHDPVDGKTAIANASFGTLNLKTGAFTTSATVQEGVNGLVNDVWNKVRFELDLGKGMFSVYLNGALYACFGTFGSNYNATNIVIPANTLTIARLGENENAYSNNAEIADTDMTHIAIDNIKLIENADFSVSEEDSAPENSIFYDSFQPRIPGMSPKVFGYPSVPTTTVIVQDPTDSDNMAVKMDIAPYAPSKYVLMHLDQKAKICNVEPTAIYGDTENPEVVTEYKHIIEDGKLTATVKVNGIEGTYTAPIWGDDATETAKTPGSAYKIMELEDTEYKSKKGGFYFVTGEYFDAYCGGTNVSVGLNVKHPAVQSVSQPTIDGKKNVLLNVDYYFSPDSKGKVEVQAKGDFVNRNNPTVILKPKSGQGGWLDLIVFDPKAGSNTIGLASGSNTEIVCQNEAVVLKKGEWFRMTAVFNMETGWMDVYFNGEYCLTQKPKDKQFSDVYSGTKLSDLLLVSLVQDSLSVGKIQRLGSHTALGGYVMIDNVGFYTGAALRSDEYERSYVQNFDDLNASTDLEKTEFGTDIPSSVVLAGDDTHTTALKMTVGETVDPALANTQILYRPGMDDAATDVFYKVAKVYPNNVVLLERDLADGSVAPETAPAKAIKRSALTQKYMVDGVAGFVLATYADYVNCWAKYENGGISNNIGRDWRFNSPSLSYALRARLATDIEIFIPEGAAGVLTSQIFEGTSGCHGN